MALLRTDQNAKPTPRKINCGLGYWIGYWIFFVLIFLGCWLYSVAAYGFIIGVLIGWLPSVVVAGIVSLFWPLIVLAIVALMAYWH